MRFGAAAGLRRRIFAAVLALGLGLAGCGADRDPVANAAGWHPVSPPPGQLPSGHRLWVSDELVMFSSSGGPSFAYRPRTDTWRSVTPLPPAAPRTQWAMVSTGTEIVALTESATAVYSPDSDAWRSLPPPPAKGRSVDPERWFPSVAWTGREVAVRLPAGDDVVALDVFRGRWRSLPRIGIGPERSSRIFATTAGLVAVVGADLEAPSPVYLLRPSAGQWRALPDLPGGMTNITSAGNYLFAGGTRPWTHKHDRGRYLLPEGSWESLPPAPVLDTGSVSVADGGLVALWHGTDMALAERPNGALLRPGRSAWEAMPPTPQPIREGALVSAGDDFLLIDNQVERPPGVRLLARLRPPPSGEPWPPAVAVPKGSPVCRASDIAAARNKNSFIRGTDFLITLSNRSLDACTFVGPVEVTATDAGHSAVTFPGERSSEAGLAVTALPGDDRGANVRVVMASRTPGEPRLRRECLAAPVGTHLSVSWPGAEGSVAVAAPDTYGFHLCNVEVSAFADPWPSW